MILIAWLGIIGAGGGCSTLAVAVQYTSSQAIITYALLVYVMMVLSKSKYDAPQTSCVCVCVCVRARARVCVCCVIASVRGRANQTGMFCVLQPLVSLA